jgi:pyridoxine 5-phosphate synthase
VRPDEACLVPERRAELTTEGGLDVAGQRAVVGETVRTLAAAGIVVSLFIDPDRRQLDAAAAVGAPYVELHTGTYCDARGADAARELARLVDAARYAHGLGLRVNAGHGINLDNVAGILEMPHLDTLNIGHSLVARAILVGLGRAVDEMLGAMAAYQGGRPGTV